MPAANPKRPRRPLLPRGPQEGHRAAMYARRDAQAAKERVVFLAGQFSSVGTPSQVKAASTSAGIDGVLAHLLKNPEKNIRAIQILNDLRIAKREYYWTLRHAASKSRAMRLGEIREPGFRATKKHEAFVEDLRVFFEGSARRSRKFSFAVIDMNRLKQLNDNFGHGAGDFAISRLAGRVDLVASALGGVAERSKGDEWRIFAPADAGRMKQELARAFDEYYAEMDEWRGAGHRSVKRAARWVTPSFSAGIASGAEVPVIEGMKTGEILRAMETKADARMYEAKRRYKKRRIAGRRQRPVL